MNGKYLAGGLVAFSVLFGAGLWYSQNSAYYETVTDISELNVLGFPVSVQNYQGIDADTSPLKRRACFTADLSKAEPGLFSEEADPLIAPRWFNCFDAEQIATDLESGAARVVLAEFNEPFGFSSYIAAYADGRAYLWRQMNACGSAEFAGDPLPEGCDGSGSIAVTEVSSTEAQQTVEELQEPTPSDEAASVVDKTEDTVMAAVQPKQPEALVKSALNLVRVAPSLTLEPLIGSTPERIDAAELTALEDATQPLSLHGCFTTQMSFGLLTETFVLADTAEAAEVEGGLPCFDAETLNEDLHIGHAVAFWSEKNTKPGVDRVIAVYDDGSAFVWHQKNNEYAE